MNNEYIFRNKSEKGEYLAKLCTNDGNVIWNQRQARFGKQHRALAIERFRRFALKMIVPGYGTEDGIMLCLLYAPHRY